MVFKESQQFRQTWLWILLIVSTIIPLVIIWLIPDDDFTSDKLARPIITLVLPLPLLFFYFLKLDTIIDEVGIKYRFSPIIKWRIIKWGDINQCYVRKYNALLGYGGWGIRYGFRNGWVYNVKGNMGLQIELNNKKKILIGTNKPDLAEAAIRKFYKSPADGYDE